MAEKPQDGFETYFAEKIWEMIPPFYRHEDGIAENPGVLSALVEIIAGQAAILRRSHDRLWEDQFIELCEDWAVPYIADLLGTRLVSALNKRARRVDVAKTIYYRRRKGTLRILEELISDIAGWEGKVVENFRRLGRCRHVLDPEPVHLAGRFTGTPPGGWADLRQQRGSERTGGPFDEYHHTPDMRRHSGILGRYNIPKLAFHLYRLVAYKIEGATPFRHEDGMSFTFDPSGRDVPLFMPRNRLDGYDWDQWRSAREWELPAPMTCRVLGHAEYQITSSIVQRLIDDGELSDEAANELRTLCGLCFKNENRFYKRLDSLENRDEFLEEDIYRSLLRESIVDDCGKNKLLHDAVQFLVEAPDNEFLKERTAAGNLSEWTAAASGKRLVIDPEQGRFLFLGSDEPAVTTVSYHYGFSGDIGAGTYDRPEVEEKIPDYHIPSGGGDISAAPGVDYQVIQIDDSRTYDLHIEEISVAELTLQAANRQRPYLRLNSHCTFTTDADADASLVLDGLWIGGNGEYAIILTGDFEKVNLRSCTLDPGGIDSDGNPIHAISLIVEGQVERLVIESSITGPIFTRDDGKIERICICDAIIQSESGPAIDVSAGGVHMERVTVFGAMNVHRLWATEALITGNVDVFDSQNGCFRFSAAPEGSRLPRPYEFHWIQDLNHFFTSRCFGQPGYGQLSQAAPLKVRRGAEDGSEMGAFNRLINPIKLDSLQAKVEEFMPFGLIPIYIQET